MAKSSKLGPVDRVDAGSVSTDKPCPICRGAGRIKLPIYDTEFTVTAFDDDSSLMPELTERERSYSCPECNGKPTYQRPLGEKYSVVRVSNILRNDIKDPRYIESVESQIAHRIARVMVERGLIIFTQQKGPVYNRNDVSVMEGVAGIVWPQGEVFDRVITEESPEVTQRGGRTVIVNPTPQAIDTITKAAQEPPQSWTTPGGKRTPVLKKRLTAPKQERDLILFEEPPDDEGQ